MSWSDQQRERYLAGLQRLGVKLANVVAWCALTGRPPPEEWDEPRRQRSLVWLSHAENRGTVGAVEDPDPW